MKDKSLRVLIIEDSEDDLLLTIRELKKGGYKPVYERVQTAAAMKKALKEKQWDIILCDYKMPKFNAPSASAVLKKANIDIPIIVLTGAIGEETAAECMRLGAQDYILKGNLSRLCPAIARELEDAKVRNKKKQAESQRKAALKLLRESENELRKVFEVASVGIVQVFPKNGRILRCNETFCKITGYSQPELLEMCFPELTHTEDRQRDWEIFSRAAKGEIPIYLNEKRYIRKDGSIVWVRLNAAFIRDLNGQPIRTVAICEDITEHKRVEEDLYVSEERFRLLSEAAFEAIAIHEKGVLINANDQYFKMFGYEPDEALGKEMISVTFAPEVLEFVKKQVAADSLEPYEAIGLRKDGTRFPIEIRARKMEYKGRIVRFGAIRDITDRKRTEEALRESEELYRTIFENTGTSMILIEEDMTMSMANGEFVRNTGYSSDEINGRMKWTEIVHPDDLGRMIEQHRLRRGSQGGALPNYEFRYITKTGDLRDTLLTIKLVPGTKKSIASLIDITERKKAEAALRESENRLRAQYNGNPIPTYTWQKQGDEFILKDFNDSAKTFTNGQNDSFLGRQASEMYKGRPEILQNIQRCFDEKRNIRIESISEHFMPGKIVVITFVFVPSDLVMVHMEDITERKKAEQTLRESEDKYRTLIETTDTGYVIIDQDGLVLDANYEYVRLTGHHDLSEIVGRSVMEWTAESEKEKNAEAVKACFDKGYIRNLEIDYVDAKGNVTPIEINATCMKIEGKTHTITICRDITERKQAEEQLQQTLESLKKAIGTTIQVLVSAVESRDPYTAGHQSRTAHLACAIAAEIGLPQDTIEGIRMAGTIHDIGKLSIPAEILVKPTKLTDIEFSLIKEHSKIGYEMLKDVDSPWLLAQIVYQHHERMNGSGYPRNLKGGEILLEARIMAVADVVEAMASHRPYRPTLGIEAALEEITKNKGILYDNAVVDACMKLFREKCYQFT
jgi:PAS domain S-box-containing protein